MLLTEKASYIKGLAEGMELDSKDKTTKLINALIDIIDDLALTVSDLEDECAELHEQLDAVDEDLAELEEDFYEDDEDYDEDYDDEDDDDDFCYEVECPKCHDVIYLDDEMIDEGGINCPNCGQELEFDFSCDDCSGCAGCDEEE